MSTTDDLILELVFEADANGEWTFAFKDSLLMRAATEYDRLDPDDPERRWLTLLALVVLGQVPAGTLMGPDQ